MSEPSWNLGELAIDEFIRDYWQRKPVLMRGVFAPWHSPVSPEELMALACSEDADARMILGAEDPPEIFHGPFEPEDLDDLPKTDWTVLVQETDRLVPAVSELLHRFRFIPNWRLDDVMISYAAPGGGVGAHTDQYDVFLVQGVGRRRWEIESRPRVDPAWRQDSDVAILAQFDPDLSWELEPGDVLYLPPMIPHNGIALEPCMTFSVGCRAPNAAELLAGVVGAASEVLAESDRYIDPAPRAASDPGLIPESVLSVFRTRIRQALADDDSLNRWLAEYLTEPVRGREGDPPPRVLSLASLSRRLNDGAVLRPAVVSQLAWIETAEGRPILAASGQTYPLPAGSERVARLLTGTARIDADAIRGALSDAETASVVVALVNAGVLRIGA